MKAGQEITMEDLEREIGRDLYFLNNEYIFQFFDLSPAKVNSIDLKVIYNGDSSYSVYEQDGGSLLTIIQWSKRDDYYVIPMGVAKLIAQSIISDFDRIERAGEIDGSVYSTLLKLNDLPDNEKVDEFLYYLGILLFDALGLDIYESNIQAPEPDNIFIDAVKNEFVIVDDNGYEEEFNYEEVIYIVTAADDNPFISVIKVYESRKEDKFAITIKDLINRAYNDFKAAKR